MHRNGHSLTTGSNIESKIKFCMPSFIHNLNFSQFGRTLNHSGHKYKYNNYFYCAPYSLTNGALQKSANTCFTAVGRLKSKCFERAFETVSGTG